MALCIKFTGLFLFVLDATEQTQSATSPASDSWYREREIFLLTTTLNDYTSNLAFHVTDTKSSFPTEVATVRNCPKVRSLIHTALLLCPIYASTVVSTEATLLLPFSKCYRWPRNTSHCPSLTQDFHSYHTRNTINFSKKARNQNMDNTLSLGAAKYWQMIQLFYYQTV